MFFLPFFILIFLIGLFDTGSPIFIQKRVGRNMKPFGLLKFRTMKIDTISVSTHLVNKSAITPFGKFLRKSKLDELLQLWNVLKGDMSLVGPRPNLYNQEDIIIERHKRGVYNVRPGITGLSQISKIDMSIPETLAISDADMIKDLSVLSYFKYIFLTISGNGFGDRVKR
jgi:lipopolysaccharide/colanic/teichoic acid biosynthesis glycosyltransferase